MLKSTQSFSLDCLNKKRQLVIWSRKTFTQVPIESLKTDISQREYCYKSRAVKKLFMRRWPLNLNSLLLEPFKNKPLLLLMKRSSWRSKNILKFTVLSKAFNLFRADLKLTSISTIRALLTSRYKYCQCSKSLPKKYSFKSLKITNKWDIQKCCWEITCAKGCHISPVNL